MSTSKPQRDNATDTEQDSFSDTLDSYTSLVNGLLAKSDVTDDDDMDTIRDVSSQLVDEATEIEARVEANEESVSETRELVADTRREQADVRGDVHEVKEALDADESGVQGGSGDETPTPDGSETGTQAPQTPLGDCVTLPETVANGELTANVKRARDVAADVVDYGRSVPAGYAITSSEMRTVLTAMKDDDGRTFTETVGRVIEYLDELGGEEVAVKETRGGQRTVVFDDEFVKRTVAWRQSSNHAVVSGKGTTG